MEHLEPFLDQATLTLRENLSARIEIINAGTVDFDLEIPADEAYVPGGVDVITMIPTVEIAVPDWEMVNPSLGPHDWDGNYTLMVRIWYQHPTFDRLHRALLRYGRALVEVLSMPDALGHGVVVSRMRGAYRVNPETNDRMEFEGGALVVCSFETVEVAP